jgi:hypothetical protein
MPVVRAGRLLTAAVWTVSFYHFLAPVPTLFTCISPYFIGLCALPGRVFAATREPRMQLKEGRRKNPSISPIADFLQGFLGTAQAGVEARNDVTVN